MKTLIKRNNSKYAGRRLRKSRSGACFTTLQFSAVYFRRRHEITSAEFNTVACLLRNKFIAGKDFNCKYTTWGSGLITGNKGARLRGACYRNTCFITPGRNKGNSSHSERAPNGRIPFYIGNPDAHFGITRTNQDCF